MTESRPARKEIEEFAFRVPALRLGRSRGKSCASSVRAASPRATSRGTLVTGSFKIERPDGSGDEWLVEGRMHSPSAEARKQVGEAVSRQQVKVTVALPRNLGNRTVGQFWSYFPLQDQTTASASSTRHGASTTTGRPCCRTSTTRRSSRHCRRSS